MDRALPNHTTFADLETVLHLAPQLYDAILEPARWPSVLDQFGAFFDTPLTQVIFSRPSTRQVLSVHFGSVSETLAQAYLDTPDEVLFKDPRIPRYMPLINRPVHCRQLVTDEELRGSEFYRILLQPHGIEYSMWAALMLEEADLFITLSVSRKLDAKPFDEQDVARVQLFMPHLRAMGKVAAALYNAQSSLRDMRALVDAMSVATLVVDRSGAVQHSNPAADALLKSRQGVSIVDGHLLHARADVQASLRAAIMAAAVQGSLGQPSKPVHVPLPRDDGPPLQATIMPLAGLSMEGPGTMVPNTGRLTAPSATTHAAVYITDPTAPYETSAERLQRLFGLTAAEANVLKDLTAGARIEEISATTGRSRDTVRNHVRALMQKMNVNHQAGLVSLALRATPPVRG